METRCFYRKSEERHKLHKEGHPPNEAYHSWIPGTLVGFVCKQDSTYAVISDSHGYLLERRLANVTTDVRRISK